MPSALPCWRQAVCPQKSHWSPQRQGQQHPQAAHSAASSTALLLLQGPLVAQGLSPAGPPEQGQAGTELSCSHWNSSARTVPTEGCTSPPFSEKQQLQDCAKHILKVAPALIQDNQTTHSEFTG